MKNVYLTLLLTIFSFSLYAKQIYVSPSGNDSNSGMTYDDPKATIRAALSLANPGDEVRLLPGTYVGKTNIVYINGAPETPIVIMSDSPDSSLFAVIDGGSQPGSDLDNLGFNVYFASWLTFLNLKFRNCWTDVISLTYTSYISVIGCDYRGGKRAIYAMGSGCHHFLVENCYWEQHEGVWTTFDWTEMHHGSMAYYNGALFHPSGTGGCYVFRGNTIINIFNAFRTKPSSYNQDGNGEVYNNVIMNAADNDFEPEQWAWNIHYYHNRLHNIHKMYSIDDVRGGPIYIYGNVITESKDANAIDKVSGVFKFKNGPLTEPCYAFNNSYYTEARVFKGDEATNQQMKHFNNAYYFYQGSNRFELNGWHDSYEFDYDCINQSWPPNITNNNQEQHGIISDTIFINGAAGDLRLHPQSRCIDAGKVMDFPELNWTQGYKGSAPDIGAYEGDELVQGPPFRYREPPGGNNFKEKPRIVRHCIDGNTLQLYFSAALNPATVNSAIVNLFVNETKISVLNASLQESNYKMIITTDQTLVNDDISLFFDPLPMGENGESATHWAATIKVAKIDNAIPVNYSKEKVVKENISLKVYPNPFNSMATIIVRDFHLKEMGNNQNTNTPIFIYSIQGRLVEKLLPLSSKESLTYQISCSDLISGVYFAVIQAGGRKVLTKFSVLK